MSTNRQRQNQFKAKSATLTSNLRKNNVRIHFKRHQQHWRQIL